MKILILGFTKIKYMPYLNMYLNQLNTKEDEVHLLYWSRDDKADLNVPNGVVGHKFDICMEDTIPLGKKLPIIYKYRKYARNIIKNLNPDYIIVLHSTTAYTIKDYLVKKYKKRYLFDYRDLTYEKRFKFYGNAIKQIAENAYATFTSSDGFREVLPRENVYTSHNVRPDAVELHLKSKVKNYNKEKPIRLAFWGLLRHYDINEQIIKSLGKDDRFEIHYYGRAQGRMLELMEDSKNKYNNFYFHGEYTPDELPEIANKTDIIMNIYDKIGTIEFAMGNKYYDGITFCLPQLCTKDTYMGEKCMESGVGLACNPYNQNFADEIYSYYNNLDRTNFVEDCSKELRRIVDQMTEDEKIIKSLFE